MKLIITCDTEHLEKAIAWAKQEQAEIEKYNRLGWGWAFGSNPRFFIRAIKGGISVTQTHPKMVK